ncbi:MAG: bifunctional lysine ketoglutarate reductase /saccharopine dehydrogenase family protein [Candidatus Hodarchaeota archaeon]
MLNTIGIRLEDKNKWERRTPLIPEHVKALMAEKNLRFVIQSSNIRAFTDNEYAEIGASVKPDLREANIVFAIKEIPIKNIDPEKVYIFFSHVIKGQKHNMPMLKHIIDSKATLIDYEKVSNEKGIRLIFFGNWAGLAGMNQTLWAFGQRLKILENIDNPFTLIKHTYEYQGLKALQRALKEVGDIIKTTGLDSQIVPFVCGFSGYGNVSQGAQSIYDILPSIEISPTELKSFYEKGEFSANHVYKVVFKEEHMVKPNGNFEFDLQDYYKHGLEKYSGIFNQYLPFLSILVNGIYWTSKFPRLITKSDFKDLIKEGARLKVIGDISCDIEGSIEGTLDATKPDNPVFTYNPLTDSITLGFTSPGVQIMAVDNLPCELPREASTSFSETLKPYLPPIAQADFTVDFVNLNLPREIKNAVIVYKGDLTPNYKYLKEFL